ncbi:Sucrase/ferredoxin-like-domain-containing protein [Pisolithus orientalis]|uniref:Sucrase/ferredoxin-like-domain-containing protein n=1 Tax=Pisolithus orientalis TaxID=936130 RepID=UPI0022247D75|nr:Sucrase/ferredoxin-like-domain-containing protein [Pisolithus orientalis]KAI6004397.1 Sucrase/ferredoxin-like-domain-containing protein [Pisolithus orientalis]
MTSFSWRPSLRRVAHQTRGFATLKTANFGETLRTELPGTVPPHRCYVFLHTPSPPSTYPAKFSTPVQRALLRELMPIGGSVNFSWSEGGPSYPLRPEDEEEMQEYYLTAFSIARGKVEVPAVSMKNVAEIGSKLREHAESPVPGGAGVPMSDGIHVYVCTHMARDCRCGNTGSAVARALREELHRRRNLDHQDPSARVRLAETAHVGGHKYAGNMLVYPHGEWLGLVQPEDVPDILDTILSKPVRSFNPDDKPMIKEAQVELFSRYRD